MPDATKPLIQERIIRTNEIDLNVADAGQGPPVLLLHGWPHTWRVWEPLMLLLRSKRRVLAPDLRGLGASSRVESGYDLATLADDIAGVLRSSGVGPVLAVGLDAGVGVAWMLASRYPDLVRRLALMEGLVPGLPAAERAFASGPPWWFGFHSVPGFAETVVSGNEAAYLDWFYTTGTMHGAGVGAARDHFVAAYSGLESLRCGFEHYRARAKSAEQVAAAASHMPVRQPTLAIAGGLVGHALAAQLEGHIPNLKRTHIADTLHIIPLEQPGMLSAVIMAFDT